MTTTPAMPELPEPELGYIETDKSRQPAFSARQMREALQSAQPAAAVSDEEIRTAFLANGFTIKEGHTDLKPYVYAAARAILALRPQAVPIGRDDLKVLMSAAGYVHATAQEKADFINGFRNAEAHHGITAPAGGEGV